MKSTASVLSLLALLALVPCAQCVAQTIPAAPPADVAQFLAALSGTQNSTPAGTPAAGGFQWILCDDHDDCPTGQLCCYPCGIDGCPFVCMTPERNRCPIIP